MKKEELKKRLKALKEQCLRIQCTNCDLFYRTSPDEPCIIRELNNNSDFVVNQTIEFIFSDKELV